jgi:hypothetical protein
MSDRPFALLPAVLGLVAATSAAIPASAQNQTQNQAQPPQSAAAAPAPTPVDVPGAVALLTLFNPEKAKPRATADSAALTVAVPNGARSQQVFASGQVYMWRGIKVRQLWTYAEKFSGPLDAALGLRLLTESDRSLPAGSWVVMNGTGDVHYVAFEAFIPADASAASLQWAVNDISQRADKLELELTGKDDF